MLRSNSVYISNWYRGTARGLRRFKGAEGDIITTQQQVDRSLLCALETSLLSLLKQ